MLSLEFWILDESGGAPPFVIAMLLQGSLSSFLSLVLQAPQAALKQRDDGSKTVDDHESITEGKTC
jgi:hypothetical protein